MLKRNERKLFLLRGVPGIGKSYWIKQNSFQPYTISSDELRLQYPMTTTPDGKKVITQLYDVQVWKQLYDILEKRMLKGDNTIIIDATHNSIKYITKYEYLAYEYGYEIVVVQFDNDLELAIEQNNNREGYKYVPEDVIQMMYKRIKDSQKELETRYQVMNPDVAKNIIKYLLSQPKIKVDDFVYETFDYEYSTIEFVSRYIPAACLLLNFNQRNRWHSMDLATHSSRVFDDVVFNKNLLDNALGVRKAYLLCLAALFHDIGKPWSAIEDRTGNKELHFPDHQIMSAKIWKDLIAHHFDITQEESDLVYNWIIMHDQTIENIKNDLALLVLKKADAANHRNVNKEELATIEVYIINKMSKEK